RAPMTMPLWSPRNTACGHTVTPAPSTTLPMIVASGCTNALGSIRGSISPRAYSVMGRKVGCPGVETLVEAAHHVCEIAEQGSTIVAGAIEPDPLRAPRDDPAQPERS